MAGSGRARRLGAQGGDGLDAQARNQGGSQRAARPGSASARSCSPAEELLCRVWSGFTGRLEVQARVRSSFCNKRPVDEWSLRCGRDREVEGEHAGRSHMGRAAEVAGVDACCRPTVMISWLVVDGCARADQAASGRGLTPGVPATTVSCGSELSATVLHRRPPPQPPALPRAWYLYVRWNGPRQHRLTPVSPLWLATMACLRRLGGSLAARFGRATGAAFSLDERAGSRRDSTRCPCASPSGELSRRASIPQLVDPAHAVVALPHQGGGVFGRYGFLAGFHRRC